MWIGRTRQVGVDTADYHQHVEALSASVSVCMSFDHHMIVLQLSHHYTFTPCD